MARREEVIDHVEALLASRIIDAADVDEGIEQAARIIAQEGQHAHDVVARHQDRQFAVGDLAVEDGRPKRVGEVVAKLLQVCAHCGSVSARWSRCGGSSSAA
jgi:hypothetical protein